MMLLPSGKSLFYCAVMAPDEKSPTIGRASQPNDRLFGAIFPLQEETQNAGVTSLQWVPLNSKTMFSSEVLVRNDLNQRVLLSESKSAEEFELSEFCSRHDWNALTALKIDNGSHLITYARGIGLSSDSRASIRERDTATFATMRPGTNSMVVTYTGGAVEIVNLLRRDGELTQSYDAFNEMQDPVLGAAFASRKRNIAIYTKTAIQLLDKGGAQLGPELRLTTNDNISAMSFSPSGEVIIANVLSRQQPTESMILAFDASCLDGKSLGLPYVQNPPYKAINYASFSNDCLYAVFVLPNELQVVSVVSGELVSTLKMPNERLIAAYFYDESTILVISGHSASKIHWPDMTVIREYDLREMLASTHQIEIKSAEWLPAQHALGITYETPDVVTSAQTFTLLPLEPAIRNQLPAPDVLKRIAGGGAFVACGHDGRVFVVRRQNRDLVVARADLGGVDGNVLNGTEVSVTATAVTPDSSRILTGHVDGAIKFWDATTGDALLRTQGTGAPVKSISISADSRKAIVTYVDGAVQLIGDVYLRDSVSVEKK